MELRMFDVFWISSRLEIESANKFIENETHSTYTQMDLQLLLDLCVCAIIFGTTEITFMMEHPSPLSQPRNCHFIWKSGEKKVNPKISQNCVLASNLAKTTKFSCFFFSAKRNWPYHSKWSLRFLIIMKTFAR